MSKTDVNAFIAQVKGFLGADFQVIKPQEGPDLILRSKDGTRQIRFDISNPHGLEPHVNFETFKARQLFPGDKRMMREENIHIFLRKKGS